MTREIKFRMWRDGRMQPVHTMYTKVSEDWVKPAEPQNFAFMHTESLMQYTGLKDKNGKEIYEGDFVRLHEYEDVYKEVVFHKGSFCIHGFNFWPEKSEIIGNMYENPELL